MDADEPIDVGVIGVGSMGGHHARVYADMPSANLVGVTDLDRERARSVAEDYGTVATDRRTLLESVDAVSVVVPTEHHYDVAVECLEANVAALVEKPVVADLETGRDLLAQVERASVPVQVGHVERFNPAVSMLEELLEGRSIIAIKAERLGPPPDRRIDDSAVLDLMIHDIDVVCWLLRDRPVSVQATGVRDNRHASALLEFESGTMASLTASRLTQRKVRTLEITTEDCLIALDYTNQSIDVHRRSIPEYVESDGDLRFRHESIIEQPRVPSGEPLRRELESFVDCVATGGEPAVTVEDGLRALEIARTIEGKEHPEPVRVGAMDD